MFSGQFVTKLRRKGSTDVVMRQRSARVRRNRPRPAAGKTTALLACLAVVAACSSPRERIDSIATDAGYERALIAGDAFRHVVYLARGGAGPSEVLRVYIEGDGSPYLSRYVVSSDPTPRQPVMLRLMALDTAPVAYVGRPCYFGLAGQPPCEPTDWTLGRFSDDVVASMAAVINRLADESGAVEVWLFGHSGGGALAVLLARRIPEATRVVTIGGVLDTDAWTALHDYAPLRMSLNPVDGGELGSSVTQVHLAGARDENVPPELIETAAGRLGAADVRVLPGVSHSKGWEAYWPAILACQ